MFFVVFSGVVQVRLAESGMAESTGLLLFLGVFRCPDGERNGEYGHGRNNRKGAKNLRQRFYPLQACARIPRQWLSSVAASDHAS